MSKLPLVDGILNYIEEDNLPLSMPGHKNGRAFNFTLEGKNFLSKLIECDITEVEGVDNLHKPEGIIKESLDLLSRFYDSKKSYFLVNGSTSGNLAMIFANFNEGDKIIVERNCHRSVYNGIIMRKLNPIYIKNNLDKKYEVPFPIGNEDIFTVLKKHSDAKGILLTYPNYYGICCDLESIIKEAKKYGMKVLIDSAHGAHFKANSNLPKDALEFGCDMVVESSHKTLPSFTQTAFLHVNNNVDVEKIDFYVSAFLSTSPSYMLMASMDYGRFYLEEYGQVAYDSLISLCDQFRDKINQIKGFHIIGKEDILKGMNLDKTRYIINVEEGYSGHKLLDYLRKNKIQCELSDSRNVLAIFSPFNDKEDFQYLYEVLKSCDLNELKEENKVDILEYSIPKVKLLPYEVMEKKEEKEYFKKCKGKICKEAIVPYPPGIPLVMPGEIIDNEIIKCIEYYLENKMTILGIKNENISIVKI